MFKDIYRAKFQKTFRNFILFFGGGGVRKHMSNGVCFSPSISKRFCVPAPEKTRILNCQMTLCLTMSVHFPLLQKKNYSILSDVFKEVKAMCAISE